nr:PREDICTED: serine/arginine-rich splicing factor 4-like [Megachile rotundata]
MAPSGKKTRNYRGKNRKTQPRSSHRQRYKPKAVSHHARHHRTVNMPEMVYRLLNAAKHNQGRGESEMLARSSGRYHGKVRKYQNLSESSYDTSPVRESTMSVDGSKYTKSGATSTENTSRVMDATNSSGGSGSCNSSVSNISVEPITLANTIDNTRALLKKKSLVQVINSYIKAGIEEGKRQAKKYIRKALSFGMKSGYLIPADPQGQVLHVSPTLVGSRKSDTESRKRRRRIRRGEEEPYTDRRERRKETPPWNTKRKRHREATPSPITPIKKRKKGSTTVNPQMNLHPEKPVAKKKTVEPARKPSRKKSNVSKKKSKMAPTTLSGPSKEQSQKVKAVPRTRSKHKPEVVERRRSPSKRNTKSPSRSNEKDSRKKDSRRSSDEDSVTFCETIERRRSESSQEDVLRDNNVPPGSPGKEVEGPLETPSNEDNVFSSVN